jgi:hypothetical protein
MAGVISENYLSRAFTNGQNQGGRELVYDVVDTDDESEVESLILGQAPSIYQSRTLDSISAEPFGGGVWKGYARYIQWEDTKEYTFETGGGTTRITQSIATIASYAPPGLTAPNFNGAIGVSEDRVEGVDIVIPAFQFSETHIFSDASVSQAYKDVLTVLTGRVNAATFRNRAEGEVLFLGASGSRRGDGMWPITFRFSVSPNATGLTVGGITGIDKGGWHYLWARYGDFADMTSFSLVKRATAIVVDQVYYPGNFSLLNIGT